MATPRRTVQRGPLSDQGRLGQPIDFPRTYKPGSRTSNLPLDLSTFVGRERELRELRGLARTHRLLSLTGVGGVGKSRLAIRLADERLRTGSESTWLVDLTTVEDPALAPSVVAETLGVQSVPGQDHLDSLTSALRQRAVLLVLDNCEHILEGAARIAIELLRTCTNVRIVATSRQPLRVDGEAVWVVPPLSNPPNGALAPLDELMRFDAVLLFLERGRSARPGFTLTEANAAALMEICQRLDGLPLALELAAARLRSLGISQISARLETGFDLLSQGPRNASARHQTLRATVDWSHEALTTREQVLFRRLAVFSGGWTLEAAEAVCGLQPEQTLEALSSLVDQSLVVADDWAGQARYRFLETIRQYALERLVASNEETELRYRHLDWCAELVRHDDPWFGNAHQAAYLELIDAEIDNIRAGLAWSVENGRAQTALRMSTELLMFWHSRGIFREGSDWIETALDVSRELSTSDRACALGTAAYLAFMLADPAAADRRAKEALACAEIVGDPFSVSMSLVMNGGMARLQGAFGQARALYERALAIAREHDVDYPVMTATYHLAELARLEQDYERSVLLYEEVQKIGARHGDEYHNAYAVFGLGHIAFLRGDVAAATSAYRRTLAIWQSLRDRCNMRWALEGLGWCASFEGRGRRAARLLGAAEALGEQAGAPLVPHLMADHDRAVEKASAELGEQAFRENFDTGRELGLELALREALEEIQPADDGTAQTSWSPLTDRERDVAQLVARGMSNRSIAETLVLGTRTVESHISRILSKLQLSSRAQLAVWANNRMSGSVG